MDDDRMSLTPIDLSLVPKFGTNELDKDNDQINVLMTSSSTNIIKGVACAIASTFLGYWSLVLGPSLDDLSFQMMLGAFSVAGFLVSSYHLSVGGGALWKASKLIMRFFSRPDDILEQADLEAWLHWRIMGWNECLATLHRAVNALEESEYDSQKRDRIIMGLHSLGDQLLKEKGRLLDKISVLNSHAKLLTPSG